MVAMEALGVGVSFTVGNRLLMLALIFVAGDTHIPPRARIATTAIFSLPPICKDHTSEIGRMAKIKSPTQLIAEYPKVAATTIEVSRHLPCPPANRVQKYSVGIH